MSQDRLCDLALMSLERKKQKAGFDEITDEIASIKVAFSVKTWFVNMPLKFYHFNASQPSRAVLMTLKALGLDFEVKNVDLLKVEQKSPEYLKVNPRGKVPAMTDGNLALHESRAMAAYLCNKYAKNEKQSLYPSDPEKRFQVDKMLYVSEWVTQVIEEYLNFEGVVFRGEAANEKKLPEAKEALRFLENSLQKQSYVAADHVTIADFFAVTGVTPLDVADYNDYGDYPRLVDWLKRMKELRFYKECNESGSKLFTDVYQGKVTIDPGLQS